jgi:hypothetical protein
MTMYFATVARLTSMPSLSPWNKWRRPARGGGRLFVSLGVAASPVTIYGATEH